MRPTKEALVRKVCKNMELVEYAVDDVLVDNVLQEITSDVSAKVIFSITKPNQVSNKLFLTSHQFTNVVGTDIYIYIGNNYGQTAYQMILEELSNTRRIDEKLVDFLRNESNDSLVEINFQAEIADHVTEKIAATIDSAPDKLIYACISESQLNKGIGNVLLEAQFDAIGDSHIFIYSGNTIGSQMIYRLSQEPFVRL